ncbi:MAG: phosphotransacetylase family protein [Planctomycetota bacterium]
MAETRVPKKVFVAATGQDQGKTTVSLGLMQAFEELCGPAGFLKPVGQRYVEVDGVRVDEDVALMRAIFPNSGELADMSPVTVGKSFTRDYIFKPEPEALKKKILTSFERMARGKRSVVIEGTGHAGVGSCFDASNAEVARLLEGKVVLVAGGGIGKPIDEVLLNRSLFEDSGVELLGVILNKVLPEKLDSIRDAVQAGLARKGISLLGCIPNEPRLSNPSMLQIYEELGGKLLNGREYLENNVEAVVVGAMAAHRALEYIRPNCLLITPGDRDDLVLAAVGTCALAGGTRGCVSGILLTGGTAPNPTVLDLMSRTRIPVILHDADSYTVASEVHALKVKIQPTDREKISLAPKLVREHVDIPGILDRI